MIWWKEEEREICMDDTSARKCEAEPSAGPTTDAPTDAAGKPPFAPAFGTRRALKTIMSSFQTDLDLDGFNPGGWQERTGVGLGPSEKGEQREKQGK